MSIPQEIKNLFKNNSVEKRYRIKFPNGERPDITGDNIEAETVRITESLCSQDSFKFGLCESSIFEASVHEIEEKMVPIKTASGTEITITDGKKRKLNNFRISGHTTIQEGIPSPNSPVEIKSADMENLIITDGEDEEQIISVWFENEFLNKYGELEDKVEKYSSGYRLHKKLKLSQLPSSATELTNPQGIIYFRFPLNDALASFDGDAIFDGYCSHFPKVSKNTILNAVEPFNGICIMYERTSFSYIRYLYIIHESISTKAEIEEWLAENKVMLLYATSTKIKLLPQLALFENYQGTTHFETDGVNKPEIYIEYIAQDDAIGYSIGENSNPLRGNIKGLEIDVSLEVDISSLPDEIIAEYGKTACDVPFPYYEIPKGRYTVYNCKKNTGNDAREIVAYDKMNSGVIDASLKPWLESVEYAIMDSGEALISILAYHDMYLETGGNSTDSADNTIDVGEIVQYADSPLDDSGDWSCYQPIKKDVLKKSEGGLETILYTYWAGSKEEVAIPAGKYIVKVEYDMEVVSELNRKINALTGNNTTPEETLKYFKTFAPAIGNRYLYKEEDLTITMVYEYQEFKTLSTFPPYRITEFADDITGYIACQGTVIIDDGSSLLEGTFFCGDETKYNIIKSIKLLPISEKLSNELDLGIKVDFGYNSEEDTLRIPDEDFTFRNIIGGLLELSCSFGHCNNKGNFELLRLGKAHWELLEEWSLPKEWVLNYSEDTRIPEGEEEVGWYDEDYNISTFGAVECVDSDGNSVLKHVGNAKSLRTYTISDNVLFNNGIIGERQMVNIMKNMCRVLGGIMFAPMEMKITHEPHREMGDEIYLVDDGKEIGTYILNRITTGIVSLADEIDTTNIAQ